VHDPASSEFLRALPGVAVLALDARGLVAALNDDLLAQLGLTAAKAVGLAWVDRVVTTNDREAAQRLFAPDHDGTGVCTIDTLAGPRRLKWHTRPVHDASGERTLVCTGMYLGEPPQLAEHSQQRLEEWRYALDQSAIVAITDQRGVILDVNEKFCEISQYGRDELVGEDHRIVNSGYHAKDFIRELWRTIANGEIWRGEIRNRAKDGSYYWVDTTIVPLLDGQGKPRQYLAIHTDITQRKIIEAQLRDQAALTKLGELAAIVAHEVRNPLAGLRGSLEILLTRLPPEMRERQIVGTMLQRIDTLNETVRDILLFAGTSEPRLQPVSLYPVLHETAASAAAATRGRCDGVEVDLTDATIAADPQMARVVFLNLILNACQASRPGVPVRVSTRSTDDMCHVAILDRGAGIPPEIRDRMFEPFATTKPGGTGLGLAIVRRLVERQGGGVSLVDRAGGGTVATVSLPLQPSGSRNRPPRRPVS
jgi:PAS domain S-box-containing protein